METFNIKDLTFTYPGRETPALQEISFSLEYGEMAALCGKSGCGKSTLLRNLKSVLAPHGEKKGEILFYGTELDEVTEREQAERIGYVLQDPDNQIVTDKVWHELAFGLENLGYDSNIIRIRVAEMASYFGIQTWFNKDISQLSGGQKQILNLAAVMAMQPDVLILDEPTSQLDPIAAADFLDTVKKLNREIGTTVLITEHRLEDVLPAADRVLVMDEGKLIIDDTPANAGAILAQEKHDMFFSMPTPLQTYSLLYDDGIGSEYPCPTDVGEGRRWLTEIFRDHTVTEDKLPEEKHGNAADRAVIKIKDIWFRYLKDGDDVIKGLSLKVLPGEIFAIVGGNGTGKSTALSIMAGIRKPYRGRTEINEEHVVMLPQNPQTLFVEESIRKDLLEMLESSHEDEEAKKKKILEVAELVEITELLDSHPYDVSGGEQQRAALAKVLLAEPQVLLLDEPTKGMDNHFKNKLAGILRKLADRGVSVVMVSHDIEFCGRYADRCAMFFDGSITTVDTPRKFFSGNSFYTTAANRMSRHLFRNAVTSEDIADLVKRNIKGEAE